MVLCNRCGNSILQYTKKLASEHIAAARGYRKLYLGCVRRDELVRLAAGPTIPDRRFDKLCRPLRQKSAVPKTRAAPSICRASSASICGGAQKAGVRPYVTPLEAQIQLPYPAFEPPIPRAMVQPKRKFAVAPRYKEGVVRRVRQGAGAGAGRAEVRAALRAGL